MMMDVDWTRQRGPSRKMWWDCSKEDMKPIPPKRTPVPVLYTVSE